MSNDGNTGGVAGTSHDAGGTSADTGGNASLGDRDSSGGSAGSMVDPTEELLALGGSCTASAECESGYCVDGVCCGAPCSDVCAQCNGEGTEGTCTEAVYDDACGELTCPADTECRTLELVDTSNCAAIGECVVGPSCDIQDEPMGTPCNADAGSCDGSGECVVPDKATLGEICSEDDDCGSGFCAEAANGEQVCCETACSGVCQSCGTDGFCDATPADDARCPAITCDSDTTCTDYPSPLNTNRCSGFGQCATETTHCTPSHAGAAAVCVAASCTGGVVTTASVCNGTGECTTAQTSPCATGLCEPNAAQCAMTCTSTSCAASQYCNAMTGSCSTKKTKGQSCNSPLECSSNFCVDGYCCESACTGQCESCSASPGNCTTVTTPRTPCSGSGACGGYCDGEQSACVYPQEDSACGTASCSGSQYTTAPACNGSGTCAAGTTTTCTYGCLAGESTCSPCRQKSSSNMLTNPGFDGSIAGWTVQAGAAYQPTEDVEDCTGSGSVWLNNISHQITQCHPAVPSTLYSFGFRFLGTGPGDLPSALCGMTFYSDANCTTSATSPNSTFIQPVSDTTSWAQGSGSLMSPANAASVSVACAGAGGFGYYDQFYLSSQNATF